LMKKDKMGMATSLEARVPFLDHKFAEFAFSIPSQLKIRRMAGKHVLKKAVSKLLPKEIIHRKKAGFPTPIAKWMAHDLRRPITEVLRDAGSSDHGYFNRRVVARLLEEHVSGRANHEHLLFPILNFDLWYKAFFTESTAQQRTEPITVLA